MQIVLVLQIGIIVRDDGKNTSLHRKMKKKKIAPIRCPTDLDFIKRSSLICLKCSPIIILLHNYFFFSSRKEILRDLQQPQKNTDVGPENGQETKFTQN